MRVRQARPEDVPSLVALFQELDRMQADWRVFTPRPGFYDEVGDKYRERPTGGCSRRARASTTRWAPSTARP